jgi:hypothetical protein
MLLIRGVYQKMEKEITITFWVAYINFRFHFDLLIFIFHFSPLSYKCFMFFPFLFVALSYNTKIPCIYMFSRYINK